MSLTLVFTGGWIASVNVQNHERIQLQKNQIKALNSLISAIHNRQLKLKNLKDHYYDVMTTSQRFDRGLMVRRVNISLNVPSTDVSDVLFLTKLFKNYSPKVKKGKSTPLQQIPDDLLSCNPSFIQSCLHNYDSTVGQWQLRDETYSELIKKLDGGYLGGGHYSYSTSELKEKIPYSELTGLLFMTEEVVLNVEESLKYFEMIVENLAKKSRTLFNKKILKESGGLLTFTFDDKHNERYSRPVNPLSKQETDFLSARDYPFVDNYTLLWSYSSKFTPDAD
ncbi:MAG: hypothetical protein HWE23_05690 [Rhodobacteraceae bacterium]|nr:hypothetical protein [Paracoccaceae bacterium]